MKQASIKLCLLGHSLSVATLPSDSHSKGSLTPESGNVSFLAYLLFFLLLNVFGTLAAEFEVLVFACEKWRSKPKSVLLKICCVVFQVTSKCLYGLGSHKKSFSLFFVSNRERKDSITSCSRALSVLQS
ncbi:hypothetical protein AMECASPLE_028809 [Ameca splendens]|uniref:Secreted protein n=1 Tax=Ameca splendens TaxID=208324 RepID=A0ABV0YGV4_9TELE